MTKVLSQLDPFSQSIEELFTTSTSAPMRCRAWNRLQTVGMPTRRSEAFTYLPFSSLYSKEVIAPSCESPLSKDDIAPFVYPECSGSYLVFIDGIFRKDLSSVDGSLGTLTIEPYGAALKGSYRSFLQKSEEQRIKIENDPFVLLNLALSADGAFIFVSPSHKVSSTLQLLFIRSKDAALTHPKVHIALGEGAELHLISRYVSLADAASDVQNAFVEVSLEKSASLTHTLIAKDLPAKSVDFFAMRASLKDNAKLCCHNFSSGSTLSRQDYHISLSGEGADAKVHGLSWLCDRRQSHVHVIVDHKEPNSTSDQFIKTVLSDHSQASFTGKILVQQKAQKTQAYQLNNNLLLSEGAIANSKPGLEILADDVKASHGATFTQLDEDQLFYLLSRGLSEKLARSLLLTGFCKEMIDKIDLPSARKKMLEQIHTLEETQ